MGLAPYGVPRFKELIFDRILRLFPDGSYSLNADFFRYAHSDSMICPEKFRECFGFLPRTPQEPFRQEHFDVAASAQSVFEEALEAVCRRAVDSTGCRRICFAGGSALNCVANSRILLSGIADDVWVFPAAGDAGGAVGAALFAWHRLLGNERPNPRPLTDVFWGPEFSDESIAEYLSRTGIPFHSYGEEALSATVS